MIGASWPYQTNTLQDAKAPVKDLMPKEGATGWLDTWMVSSKTKNLDCAYKWLAWISTPKVQAQQAIYFGETPVNKLACTEMDKIPKGSCAKYHANAPLSYFRKIYFWKTPIADVRQRQERLHGLHQVATGLDRRSRAERALRPERAAGLGGALWRRSWLKGLGVLALPVAAFAGVYIAALVALFVSSFWTVDSFTGQLVHTWTTVNFQTLWDDPVYRHVALRTIVIAALVTIADAVIAFPFAYFMARVAGAAHACASCSCSCCCRSGRRTSRASTRGG